MFRVSNYLQKKTFAIDKPLKWLNARLPASYVGDVEWTLKCWPNNFYKIKCTKQCIQGGVDGCHQWGHNTPLLTRVLVLLSHYLCTFFLCLSCAWISSLSKLAWCIFAFCTVVREDDEFFQAMHGSCDLNPLFVRMHAMHSVRAGPRFGCSWNR